ncbi:MAG: hypothetical protein HN368_04690 [Spirochaetales bacterium]|jgi:hypothetical protein|nr:hypothetical protein [Spirochaetales bacterium]
MSKRLTTILSALSIFTLLAIDASADTIIIPPIETGMEVTEMGEGIRYSMKLEYALHNHKNQLVEGSYSLVLPVPSSSEYQHVSITGVKGLTVQRIGRDKYGNCVVISELSPLSEYPDYVTIDLQIYKHPVKLSIPPSYFYETQIDHITVDSILEDTSLRNHIADLFFEIDTDLSFEDFLQVVDLFTTDTNETAEGFETIYDESIQEFFPIDRRDYLSKAIDFIAILAENGIAGRIARGWSFPPDVDTFREDFLVHVFLPDHGMLVFDRKLDLFSDEYYFIEFFYSLSHGLDFSSSGYVGMTSNGYIHIVNEPIYMSCGTYSSSRGAADNRFSEQFYEMEGYDWGKRLSSDFIRQNVNITSLIFRTVYKTTPDKQYFDQPVEYRVKDIVLSKKLDSQYDPIELSGTYVPGEKVYATIMFRGSGFEKHLVVRWIAPGGDIFHEVVDDVKTTWTSYFSTLRTHQTMEKGLWTVEVEVNGALEMRKQFELKTSP